MEPINLAPSSTEIILPTSSVPPSPFPTLLNNSDFSEINRFDTHLQEHENSPETFGQIQFRLDSLHIERTPRFPSFRRSFTVLPTLKTLSSSTNASDMILKISEKQLKNDRKGFIKKVYALLTLQLFYTSFFTALTVAIPDLQTGIQNTQPVFIVVVVMTLALVAGILCCKRVARRYPYNYGALFVFTGFESYIVAYICASYSSVVILCVALITFAVFISLTVYSVYAKSEFTVCGGIFVSVSTSLIVFAVMMIPLHENFLSLMFCEVVVIIFSVFIVYDTQLIADGRYDQITFDDYIIGSLILYIDIVGFFVYLLLFCFQKGS